MTEKPHSTLDERQRLILMAAYYHGKRPGEEIRANCGRVLWQAMTWVGAWSEARRDNLQQCMAGPADDDDEDAGAEGVTFDPVTEDWYRVLIGLSRQETERLLDGAGNFGSDRYPAALPTFTSCRLTPLGMEVARRLLTERPECVPGRPPRCI